MSDEEIYNTLKQGKPGVVEMLRHMVQQYNMSEDMIMEALKEEISGEEGRAAIRFISSQAVDVASGAIN